MQQLNHLKLSDGLTISYFEFGISSGKPVLFFHGWPGSGRQGHFIDAYAKRNNLRIICPNRPGILGSSFQPKRKLLDWIKTVNQFTSELGIQNFSVIGVSGGAPYVYVLAKEMPQRIDKALVVCGAPLLSEISSRNLFWVYRLLIFIVTYFPGLMLLLAKINSWLLPLNHHKLFLAFAKRSLCPADLAVVNHKSFFPILLQSIEDELKAGGEVLVTNSLIYLHSPEFSLKDIKKEIVMWHGQQDRNISIDIAREMKSLMPHSRLVETMEDGHYSMAVTRLEDILQEACL